MRVIVKIAGWEPVGRPEKLDYDLVTAIEKAIPFTAKVAIQHGYYQVGKSRLSDSVYLSRTRRPVPSQTLRISDHDPVYDISKRAVNIVFPYKRQGRMAGVFYADAQNEESIQEAFLMADTEIQRRAEREPSLVTAWVRRECKLAETSRNVATFNGKPFWCGAVDLNDGEIIEVHTFEEASQHDFHHSLYFSDDAQAGMRTGAIGFFYMSPGGHVNLDHLERTEDMHAVNPHLASVILSQIAVQRPETPSPWALPNKKSPHEGD